MSEGCDSCARLTAALHAITYAIARQKGREVYIDNGRKFWVDHNRILVSSHRPCVVCCRQTRWRVKDLLPFTACCSWACYRTRFEA